MVDLPHTDQARNWILPQKPASRISKLKHVKSAVEKMNTVFRVEFAKALYLSSKIDIP